MEFREYGDDGVLAIDDGNIVGVIQDLAGVQWWVYYRCLQYGYDMTCHRFMSRADAQKFCVDKLVGWHNFSDLSPDDIEAVANEIESEIKMAVVLYEGHVGFWG